MAIQWQKWMRGFWDGLWNPDKGEQRSSPDLYRGASGVIVTDGMAMQLATVFRCIRIISETAASLPLVAYRRVGVQDKEPLEAAHWLPTLLREPNDEMTGDEWAETQYAQMAGWGNAYSQVVPNGAGRATELWPYKVEQMRVTRNENLTVKYEYPNSSGAMQDLQRKRVLHLRAFSMDGIMGLSPIGLARESLGLSVAANSFAGSFFAAGGRPSGVMTSEKLLNDKQREQIRKEYGGMVDGGTQGGKRFWLLEGSLKYQAISVSPEDMQMLETRQFEISEIARWFGVPLFLLMETEKSTSWGSGIEQINLAFLLYTLRPYLTRMVNTFNRHIIPPAERGKIFVGVDLSALKTADFTSLANYLSTGIQNGYITRNEARHMIDLPSLGSLGDVPMAQVNMAPLDQLGNVEPAALEKMFRAYQLHQLGKAGQDSARVVPITAGMKQ